MLNPHSDKPSIAVHTFLTPDEPTPEVCEPVLLWTTLPSLAAAPQKISGAQARDESDARSIVQDARRDAESIRSQAIKDAGEIVTQARENAEAIRSDALVEGYSNGLHHAREEVETELNEQFNQRIAVLKESVDTLVAAILSERSEMWQLMESEIVQLAIDIARKVIKIEIDQNTEIVQGVVVDAMRRITDRTSIRILVNPTELIKVRSCREDFMTAIDGVRNLEIDSDRRIGRGGCMIETSAGAIDAKIDTQLEQVVQTLHQ